MENEFSRTRRLLGQTAMERLKDSHVMVFGIGGVGSHCIEALARSGVGRLSLVDHDVVSVSNINRQSIAFQSTVGRYKTRVMEEKILDINPRAKVQIYEKFVLPENVSGFFGEKPDFVVDAIDTVSAKVALALLAKEQDISIISCMGTGNKLDPSAFEITDIYETSVCPLCRVMRRELKKRGVEGLTVLYSKEAPVALSEDAEPGEGKNGRPAPGSVAFVPPAAGLMLAGYVIMKLCRGNGMEKCDD